LQEVIGSRLQLHAINNYIYVILSS